MNQDAEQKPVRKIAPEFILLVLFVAVTAVIVYVSMSNAKNEEVRREEVAALIESQREERRRSEVEQQAQLEETLPVRLQVDWG